LNLSQVHSHIFEYRGDEPGVEDDDDDRDERRCDERTHRAESLEVNERDERREDRSSDGVNLKRRFQSECRSPEPHRQSAREPDHKCAERKHEDSFRVESGACHELSPLSRGLSGKAPPLVHRSENADQPIERRAAHLALNQSEAAKSGIVDLEGFALE
jgi:hypothetical protein